MCVIDLLCLLRDLGLGSDVMGHVGMSRESAQPSALPLLGSVMRRCMWVLWDGFTDTDQGRS